MTAAYGYRLKDPEILSEAVDDGRKNAAYPWRLFECQIPTRKGIRHMEQSTTPDTVLPLPLTTYTPALRQ